MLQHAERNTLQRAVLDEFLQSIPMQGQVINHHILFSCESVTLHYTNGVKSCLHVMLPQQSAQQHLKGCMTHNQRVDRGGLLVGGWFQGRDVREKRVNSRWWHSTTKWVMS